MKVAERALRTSHIPVAAFHRLRVCDDMSIGRTSTIQQAARKALRFALFAVHRAQTHDLRVHRIRSRRDEPARYLKGGCVVDVDRRVRLDHHLEEGVMGLILYIPDGQCPDPDGRPGRAFDVLSEVMAADASIPEGGTALTSAATKRRPASRS